MHKIYKCIFWETNVYTIIFIMKQRPTQDPSRSMTVVHTQWTLMFPILHGAENLFSPEYNSKIVKQGQYSNGGYSQGISFTVLENKG